MAVKFESDREDFHDSSLIPALPNAPHGAQKWVDLIRYTPAVGEIPESIERYSGVIVWETAHNAMLSRVVLVSLNGEEKNEPQLTDLSLDLQSDAHDLCFQPITPPRHLTLVEQN